MFTKPLRVLIAATLPALAACSATLPPHELLDARQAFARASNGPAAWHDTADLDVARQALSKAEQAFAEAPDAERTRDLAYLAEAKALVAEARGRNVENEKARDTADTQFKALAGRKLDAKNAALATDAAHIRASDATLAAEQTRRSELEKRLRDAMARITALANVKEEPRGTVITLSGSVLFASDKSDLLSTAAERLNDVADALMAEPDRSVTILGFTDSTGDRTYNQALSERRAEAVRTYLISRGVSADQLTAVGKGQNDPVADNSSPEGRANNRRVEIVIAPAQKSDVYSP